VGTLICNCARSNVPLQLTVAIGSSAPPPTGTATFYSGNTVLGPPPCPFDDCYPYIASAATLNVTNLPVGADHHRQYGGDTNDQAATSNSIQVTVSQQPAGYLTASANASSMLPTQNLTVTANVAGTSGLPAPTGYIFMYADGPGGSWSTSCTLVNDSCSQTFSGPYWSPGNRHGAGDLQRRFGIRRSGVVVPVTMLNVHDDGGEFCVVRSGRDHGQHVRAHGYASQRIYRHDLFCVHDRVLSAGSKGSATCSFRPR